MAQGGDVGVLTLSGEGPVETQAAVLRAVAEFEARMAVPLRVAYRMTTSAAAATDMAADAAQQSSTVTSGLQFVISEQPLSAAQRLSFTGNAVLRDSVHYPLYVNTYGLFYNVPGNRGVQLNLTACLAARILKGDIVDWTHPDLLDKNPGFIKGAADSFRIQLLADDPASGSTAAVMAWLSRACPQVPVTFASLRSDFVPVGSGMVAALQVTAFSFGWAPAAAGRAAGVPEFAVESKSGQYLTSASANATNLATALASVLPTTLTGDYNAVSAAGLAADRVAPILAINYLVTKADWSQSTPEEGQRGEAVKAFAAFLAGAEVAGSTAANAKAGLASRYGLLPLGDAIAAAIRTSAATAFTSHASAVPYTTTDGSGANVLSSSRASFTTASYIELQAQIAALRRSVDAGAARVLRGVGSSAVSLFVWRCFTELKGRSTSPLHLVYRAAGSGAGQNEVVAKSNGYQALVEFGASDTPMSDTTYTDLTANAKISVVHIPMLLAPMNFFANIPDTALPSRALRMKPCTIARIMQGDITSWAHADITADNELTTALPDQPIVVFYRQLSSGTTNVITAYLQKACSDWRLGTGGVLANWPTSFRPTANSNNMSTSVGATPWSIGYMDAANGLDLNLLEISMRNKDGNYVTSQTGDVTGAASALFKSDTWPKSPTQSFSSVSCLDQPGAKTFPIVAMPFAIVRTDLVSRGDAGALLQAFLAFMLDSYAQNTVAPAVGFAPLPQEVLTYALQRALPLLQADTTSKAWALESGAVLPGGRGSSDYVISSFAGNYDSLNSQTFADFHRAYTTNTNAASRLSGNASANATSNRTSLTSADVPDNLKDQLRSMDQQIKILQSVAISGLVFGIVGLGMALFTSCRMFVASAMWGTQREGLLVHPSSIR
ncbi:hypothetical protein HYH03_007190 [Edaphochlamys debaryana]|uniref:PBP domain-containing protein n=1 Tax=Edaphochlamys debaryana TaxID=47281 RepID=A0A835YBV6_9CHLO|nr:hypothetical protein HYH03_007190 [Edaphochlamys debaryana]|eukprot:KAG2494674.1 hypothetical protein HYH03_007190 [Edaphochlamys debaryana]